MTCQHCQTWILDGEHRCQRCGRRVRGTPNRISPTTYPIAAAATARAYDFAPEVQVGTEPAAAIASEAAQQRLFISPVNEPRVIAFDSLASASERKAIRERAAEHEKVESVKSARVDSRKARAKRVQSPDQHKLEFFSTDKLGAKPHSDVVCDAPVAPASLRIQAAVIDLLIMALGCSIGAALFYYVGGTLTTKGHTLAYVAAALATVPLFYQFLWAFAGRDSIGLQKTGLELVDFDGRFPSRRQRYQRLAGSILSVLAAGVGLAWALLDEDKLTWHDHISCTFPTLAPQD